MLDRRDQLLDKLSSLANVTVTEAARPHGHGQLRRRGQTARRRHDRQLAPDAHRIGRRPARRAARPDRRHRRAHGRCRPGSTTSRKRSRAPSTNTSPQPFFSGTTAATLAVAVKPSEVQASGTNAAGGNEVAQRDRRAARRHGRTGLRGAGREGRQRRTHGQRRTDQPADDRHRDQRPAPERLGRLARRRNDQPDHLPARLPGLRADADRDGRNARNADRAHRRGGAVGMSERITPAMVTSSTLNDLNASLASLQRTHRRTVLRQDDPRTVGQPLRREPGDRPAEPARRAELLRKQRPGRDLLGEHRQQRDVEHEPGRPARARTAGAGRQRHLQPERPRNDGAAGRTADRERQAGRQHAVRRPVRLLGDGDDDARPTNRAQTTNTTATPKRSAARSGRARR